MQHQCDQSRLELGLAHAGQEGNPYCRGQSFFRTNAAIFDFDFEGHDQAQLAARTLLANSGQATTRELGGKETEKPGELGYLAALSLSITIFRP